MHCTNRRYELIQKAAFLFSRAHEKNSCSSFTRFFASKSKRPSSAAASSSPSSSFRNWPQTKRKAPHAKKESKLESKEATSGSETLRTDQSSTLANGARDWRTFLVPVRYRTNGYPYNQDHAYALAQRIPFVAVLFGLLYWDQTAPFAPIQLVGPSMLPTMAADGSEVWLVCSSWLICLWRYPGFLWSGKPFYRKGDLVGFSPPNNKQHVSCKRVVGLPGETVASFGQFAKLFMKQDPVNAGRVWPEESHHFYEQARQRFHLEQQLEQPPKNHALRTEVVPDGHYWLEGDCPFLALDSRQIGSVPQSWIRGVVVARLWPIWRLQRPTKRRPHPIPLDEDTLEHYNVHPKQEQ